jgi:hypothetical protein
MNNNIKSSTINLAAKQLERYEADIADGLNAFFKVGKALARIRDERLYKGSYDSFDAYCRERWDMVASRARQLCAAASVVDDLKTVTNVTPGLQPPDTEALCRPLMKLDADQRCDAWKLAKELAGDNRMTAKVVQEAADKIQMQAMSPSEKVRKVLEDGITGAMIEQLEAGKVLKRVKENVEAELGYRLSAKEFDGIINGYFGTDTMDATVWIQATKFAEAGMEPKRCVPMAYSMAEAMGNRVRAEFPLWKCIN